MQIGVDMQSAYFFEELQALITAWTELHVAQVRILCLSEEKAMESSSSMAIW